MNALRCAVVGRANMLNTTILVTNSIKKKAWGSSPGGHTRSIIIEILLTFVKSLRLLLFAFTEKRPRLESANNERNPSPY